MHQNVRPLLRAAIFPCVYHVLIHFSSMIVALPVDVEWEPLFSTSLACRVL